MLGVREPAIYGTHTLDDVEQLVRDRACQYSDVTIDCSQSNHEGTLIDTIQAARGVYDGIIYNPGAHTHYSYALRDAIAAAEVPTVEVHISDIDARESFRAQSVIQPVCIAQIKGRGIDGYGDALDELMRYNCCDASVSDHISADKCDSHAECAAMPAADSMIPDGPHGDSDASCARLARVRRALDDADIDAFFMRDLSSIAWLTGFDGVFDTEDAHALYIDRNRCLLHTDSRYTQACREAAEGGPIAIDDARQSHEAWLAGLLSEIPREHVALGIERSLCLGEYRLLERSLTKARADVSVIETAGFSLGLRAIKGPHEIERIQKAQDITDAAFAHITTFMKPGMTEREVQIELEDYMIRHGADGLAFASIVATGANGASPHSIPGRTKIEAGQCIVMDFGARAQGYCSDMTRTVFAGTPDARIADAYAVVRRANEEVEAMLAPGVTGSQAHEHAESVLADGGYAGAMGHALGHGVGIDIHELPVLAPRNDQPLLPGSVVTVEPGIYIDGDFGIRLEDFGVITQEGYRVFTRSTHEMTII